MKRLTAISTLATILSFQNLPAHAADPLFDRGQTAYAKADYLAAAEHLFAYREANRSRLDPGFLKEINAAIEFSESQVAHAFKVREELAKHGKVVEVVSSGKADDPGSSLEKKGLVRPVRLPANPRVKRPGLSQTPRLDAGQPVTQPVAATVVPAVVEGPAAQQLRDLEKQCQTLRQENARLQQENARLKRGIRAPQKFP